MMSTDSWSQHPTNAPSPASIVRGGTIAMVSPMPTSERRAQWRMKPLRAVTASAAGRPGSTRRADAALTVVCRPAST